MMRPRVRYAPVGDARVSPASGSSIFGAVALEAWATPTLAAG